jgi:hypothetical protein
MEMRKFILKIMILSITLGTATAASAMAIDIDFYMTASEYQQAGYGSGFSLQTADLAGMLNTLNHTIRTRHTEHTFGGVTVNFIMTAGGNPATALAEPGTLGLFALGIALIGGLRRRQSR